MSIVYYPNRVFKGKVPAIDRVMVQRRPYTVNGTANVFSSALSAIITDDNNWQVDSIAWQFSNTAPRNFTATIMHGRKVVENLNDYLWFSIPACGAQRVILNPGFYNGTQLATELQTRMNAATFLDGSVNGFNTAGITFAVVYNAATGRYTITPNAGTIRYLAESSARLSLRDSIAGHLFGLNTTTAFAASVSSDTTVFGLDSEVPFVSETASAVLTYLHNNFHILTMDQAVHLTSNAGANVSITYVVDYETIV